MNGFINGTCVGVYKTRFIDKEKNVVFDKIHVAITAECKCGEDNVIEAYGLQIRDLTIPSKALPMWGDGIYTFVDKPVKATFHKEYGNMILDNILLDE